MSNNSYSSRNTLGVLLVNGSWSEDNITAPAHGLTSLYLPYLQSFPTWIANTVFNIIYVVGILSNLVLLVYLIYYKRYKTPVFCVILSLGVADLNLCVATLILYTRISPFIVGPMWLCNLAKALSWLSWLVSNYHIAVFAVLRFFQLVYPLASRAKVTTSLLSKVCLTIWTIYSIHGVVIGYYVEAVNISSIESTKIYTCLFAGSQHGRYILSIWVIVISVILPFIATSGFHVAKQFRVMISHSQDERGQQVRRQTDSRALAAVVVLYLATMVPFNVQIIRMYLLNRTLTQLDTFLYEICKQITYTNSAINPWIYLFGAESVRSDIRHIITCNKGLNKYTANVT